MNKKNYKNKEEVLKDLEKAEKELYDEGKDSHSIDKSILDKVNELRALYENFDKR